VIQHRLGLALALCAALLVHSSVAQERIIGLVEIAVLHGQVNDGSTDAPIEPVALRVQPVRDSGVAIVVRDRRQLESREHGYEQMSAVVYERVYAPAGGLWYRLRYDAAGDVGYGWLEHTAGMQYRETSALLTRGLAYLTAEWDRRLWERPAADAAVRTLDLSDPAPAVKVIDVFIPSGSQEPWYLLAIVTGVCTGEPIEVVTTAWVPAYAESGANNVWFYSRGC
jgi:hypothetical protein